MHSSTTLTSSSQTQENARASSSLQDFRPRRLTILDEAAKATDGDRPATYGHPLDHFSLTISLVNARFAHKLKEPLTADEWPIIMMLDKIARHANRGQRDSLVDVAGYARTVEMLEVERERRSTKDA